MGIRVIAIYIYVAFLFLYAWKDWFKSLCGLILLMAVIEYEDMPKSMFGIQGLNMWNVLFLGVLMAWAMNRRREGLTWDMPRHVSVALLMYFAVILLGTLREYINPGYMGWYPLKRLISDEVINTIKWVLPALLLFDGCRTRKRVLMALVCILGMYFLISVLVIRRLPIEGAFTDSASITHSRVKLDRSIGYNACDVSGFLAGVSWGILALTSLIREKKYWVIILAAAGIVAFAQALSGGRAGYLAWGVTGLALCLLRWRKLLILAPVVVILLPIVFPGVVERMLTGFGVTNAAGQTTVDEVAVTSGRSMMWPLVVDKIGESPMVGYGRRAMQRTGLTFEVRMELKDSFPHPHNMYLETLLDNGILGSIPIFIFWGIMLLYSARLFRSDNRLCSAVGGVALALMLAQLVAGIGAQHFYPKESTLGMWAAMLLSLRVYVEKSRAQIGPIGAESVWNGQPYCQPTAVASACTPDWS